MALEPLRETLNYVCDSRRPISTLSAEFPKVDFAACPDDHDELWNHYERLHGSQEAFQAHRESADLPHLAERARSAFAWIGARPEAEIVLVGHQAFMWNVLNMGRSDGPEERLRGLPPVVAYGGADDAEHQDAAAGAFETWISSPFANCECRSVWAEFY